VLGQLRYWSDFVVAILIQIELGMNRVQKCSAGGIVTNREEARRFFEPKDFFEKNWRSWKYKMRLGEEAYISTDDKPVNLIKDRCLTIKPGEFALLLTRETLRLDHTVMAFISIRFDYKQKGLINVSGFHVDPNYYGKIIFSVFNAGPKDIVLRYDDPVFMIFFQCIDGVEKESSLTPLYQHIPAEMMEQIKGRSATLASNATRLDKMEFYFKIIGGTILTIFAGAVAGFIVAQMK